jgi:hypothetical protein
MDSGAVDGVDSLLQGLWMTRLRKPWPPAANHRRWVWVLPLQLLQHHIIKRRLCYAVVLFAWQCVIEVCGFSGHT